MNRNFKHNGASIIDLAPTILNYLQLAVPKIMEGTSLL
jgi:bisphosphoglycerate-independent phosphoglycerate mutase (AlkP superfamily)